MQSDEPAATSFIDSRGQAKSVSARETGGKLICWLEGRSFAHEECHAIVFPANLTRDAWRKRRSAHRQWSCNMLS